MSTELTRRNFVAGAGAVAGALGLAACANNNQATPEPSASEPSASESSASGATGSGSLTPPDASAYPIEPDGTEHLGSTEKVRDGWTKITNPGTDLELGVMDDSKIIIVDGLAFKDMNGNGKLDLYEDWRQDSETRAAALAEMLSIEDIAPLMFHGGVSEDQTSTDTTAFGLVEKGSRAGVSRLQSNPESYATDVQWINQVQEVCEKSTYGIPFINSSDPYVLFDVPSSIGLAATMDADVWRKAGMWQARAWRATGVRLELGPQVDVYSSPIGTRTNGSVCEDPAVNRDFTKAFGGGMQSTWGDDEATDDQGWGKDSVAVMLKHFVGEGSNEGGRDDHSDSGKWDVFPGGNFNAHLIPFFDGGLHLDSKTEQMSSVMPCYGIAYDPNDPEGLGEPVGSAYSKRNMSLLRNTGWDGMICTDWMILTGIAHGVTNLSEPERLAKMYGNTINQYGGGFEPEMAVEAHGLLAKELGEDYADQLYRDSARRIFKLMNDVQLFDNPYSDRTVAKEIMENEAAYAFGMEAAEKSVIMLKNKDNIISKDGLDGKVYVPQKYNAPSGGFFGMTPASIAPAFTATDAFDLVTDTVADPTGEPAEEGGDPTAQETDITRLTAAELADVKYAIVGVSNPNDAFQGVEGGKNFLNVIMGTEPENPVPTWKPISLQYRPFTADGDYVRETSLNPADENGVTENRSVKGQSTNATNENELDLVISIKEALPADAKLILVVDADRPMCYHEIEPYADAILMTFGGVTQEAVAHIIAGEVEPSGLLPFQMPANMQTVMEQLEDVPRDMDCYTDSEGNTYDFCYGLNWSGVIDDDRVATYKVAPLTQPETKVDDTLMK
ncbi:MAG: glycoside hydrolase family 3 C-terminal domain-containing protein [Atopobiaceae bacterium]|nr:glycoside hydrolase family 3 C-terminal domain-containing protein [Atopobiaceae bacterium]